MLIFVVEDDVIFNKLLTVYLTTKNIGVVKSFLSGEACLESAGEHPDIILMDYDLLKKNGLETMKEVKLHSAKTEFIFLSGQGSIKTAMATLEEGAFGYIIKDMDAKENAFYKILELKKVIEERKGNSENENLNITYY